MAKQFPAFTDEHMAFVAAQHIYFVGSAAADGRVNLSPKGRDSVRILSPNRLVWLNLTGSGNETAAHLARVNRITLMWCSFDARPLILRAYGTASVTHRGAPGWDALYAHFPADPGARQVVDVAVVMVQTSCGYAVPLMEHKADRTVLHDWAVQKGDAPAAYWAEKNSRSIDGFPTGIGP